MALRLSITFAIVALAAGCAAPASVTEPPGATPSSVATPSTAPAATATPTSVPAATPTAVAATATPVAVDPCAAALSLADVGAGFTGGEQTPIQGTGLTGFVSGTLVRFQGSGGTSISSSVVCFDSAANAAAAYEPFNATCVDANLSEFPAQTVQIGPIGGDASKGLFCPGDTSGSSTLSSQTSVVVLVDDLVFSVAINRAEPSGPDGAVVATLISLATQLLAAIGG